MTDDWSLKDKITYEDGSGWVDMWVYKKEDIETLRQKLIEDLVNIIEEYPNVKTVINKRFGVD